MTTKERMNTSKTTARIVGSLLAEGIEQAEGDTEMAIQTLKQNSRNAEPAGAGESLKRTGSMGSRRTYSRVIGATWLLGFVTYIVGNVLATSVLSAPDSLSTILAHQTTLALGGLLLLLTCVLESGKAVLFFPILEPHGKRTALTYLSALIVEVVLVAVGALGVLMVIPLAQRGVDAGAASVIGAKALGSIAIQWNTLAYQIGEMSLCFGGVFLCLLLFRTRLIPRFLSVWGVIGYAIFLAGIIAEIFGVHIVLMLSIPGGLFEVGLAFWLLIKGFQPEATIRSRDARLP